MVVRWAVIGSDISPVKEVINHGQTGLLVDFFSPKQIVDEVLNAPSKFQLIRTHSRRLFVLIMM